MIALDASLLVAHLDPRDSHHEAATQLLLGAADQTLVAHSLTLAEVLVGAARRGRARERLDDVRSVGVVLADRVDDEPLRLAELRASTGLRMPDCCVLLTALTNDGARLATFDDDLAKAARQLDVRVVPTPGGH